MKKTLFSFMILCFVLLNSCENANDLFSSNNEDNKILNYSPTELANLTVKIAKFSENNQDLTQLYKSLGEDLISGSTNYNKAMLEVKQDSEKYQSFSNELKKLLSKEIHFKLTKTEKEKNIE